MDLKSYQKPSIKVLDTYSDELMFEIGGGLSEANPDTPGVGAKEMIEDDFEGYSQYSVWDEEEEE